MTVGIVGLGLIGGSFAKAYHAAGHTVLAFDIDRSTYDFAVLSGTVNGPLTFQEYFERLRREPARWGKPLAALLGAFAAQMALGIGAVGGKDSMSGSFEQMDVPP